MPISFSEICQIGRFFIIKMAGEIPLSINKIETIADGSISNVELDYPVLPKRVNKADITILEPTINPDHGFSEKEIYQMNTRELLIHGIRTRRTRMGAPLASVVNDAPIVDTGYAGTIKDDILTREGGQQSFVDVVPRFTNTGDIVYLVTDGYHRTEALEEGEIETVDLNILFGRSDEEVIDLRILAAGNVKSLRFTRIGIWMQQAYELKPWHEKLTLYHLCNSVIFGAKKSRSELTGDEFEEAKDWIELKAKQWRSRVVNIRDIMRIVDQAAPELLQYVRVSGGSKGELNPARLGAIVDSIKDHDMQIQIGRIVMEYNFTKPRTEILAEGLANALDADDGTGTSTEEILDDPVRYVLDKEEIIKTVESKKTSRELTKDKVRIQIKELRRKHPTEYSALLSDLKLPETESKFLSVIDRSLETEKINELEKEIEQLKKKKPNSEQEERLKVAKKALKASEKINSRNDERILELEEIVNILSSVEDNQVFDVDTVDELKAKIEMEVTQRLSRDRDLLENMALKILKKEMSTRREVLEDVLIKSIITNSEDNIESLRDNSNLNQEEVEVINHLSNSNDHTIEGIRYELGFNKSFTYKNLVTIYDKLYKS